MYQRIVTTLAMLVMGASAVPMGAKPIPNPPDTVRVHLSRLGDNVDSLERWLRIYQAQRDAHAQGLTLIALGNIYNRQSNYVQAIGVLREAARTLKNVDGAQTDLLTALTKLATNCRRIGAFASASEYLFEALGVAEGSPERDTKKGLRQLSYIYNGLGNVYKYLDDDVEAERYFRLSLSIDERIQNNVGMAMNWTTLGSIYERRDLYDSAKVMYLRGLEYDRLAKSHNGVGICYNRIGHLAVSRNQFDSAEHYYRMAYEVLTCASDKWNLAHSTLSLGQVYLTVGKYDLAKRFLDESAALVRGKRSYGHEQELHNAMAQLYEKQGLYHKALEESKLGLAYLDSSLRQRSGQDVAQARLRYEQEMFQGMLDQKDREHRAEIEHQQRINAMFWIIVVLLCLIILFIIRYLRMQRRYTSRLEEANAVKNKFFTIISHDLKNPVIAQSTVLQMMADRFDPLSASDLNAQVQELHRSSQSLLNLLLSLLDWAKMSTGALKYEPIRLDVHREVQEVLGLLGEQLAQKGIEVEVLMAPGTYVRADRNIFSTVLRNLLSNAIKFSAQGGRVVLSSAVEGASLRVSVRDFGVGMSPETRAQLFSLLHTSTRGTAGEKGSGLGLIVCEEMLALERTHLQVESEPGKGSTFSFELQLSE